MTRRKLTPEQIAEATKLRDGNVKLWTFAALGERYGFSPVAVYYALNPQVKQYRRLSERSEAELAEHPSPIDEAELLRLWRAIPADTRDLTARAFNDPLPGRSALDKKNSCPQSRIVNPLLATLRGMPSAAQITDTAEPPAERALRRAA